MDASSACSPSEPAHRGCDEGGARSTLARSAHHSDQPWPQAGLGLTIATEPCALVGSTWTNFAPVCHWKMKCEATMFWPMALNFAGPCTVCTVTPLCSHEMTFAFDRLLVALTAAASVSPTEYASAESALMSAGVPPYLAL